MCKNTDDNPMPIEGEKKSAVALKSLIGIFAVTNCIMSIPSLKGQCSNLSLNQSS